MTYRKSLFASCRVRFARWILPRGYSVCLVGLHPRKGDATVALHD